MTWFEWLEKRRLLLIGGIMAIGAMALVVAARRGNVSFDSFWHLQMGMDWIRNGLSPWVDHYSFTFLGQPISSPPVFFQAMLYWFVEQFGMVTGFELIKLLFMGLTLLLVWLYLRQVRSPVFAYLIVIPLVVLLMYFRASVRPELLSYALAMIALMLYHRANGVVKLATVAPMALLMLFWSNYHNPIIGYVIFCGFFLDAATRQWAERKPVAAWFRWLLWGLLVVGVGFLRPGFSHPLFDMLTFDPQWKVLIQEYTSPFEMFRGIAGFYALVVVAGLAFVLALTQRKFGYLLIIAVMAYGGGTMARLVTPAGIIIACLFAHLLAGVDWSQQLQRLRTAIRSSALVAVLLLVAAPLSSTVTLAKFFMAEQWNSDPLFPSDVVSYINRAGYSGRVFNQYQTGGYLIYTLSPRVSVYIDGRTDILYPAEHYMQLLRASSLPTVFMDEQQKYDFDMALLENEAAHFFVMSEADGFGLDYVGAVFSLFVKNNPNYPAFGDLLGRPACWNENLATALESEESLAAGQLPHNSYLWPFMTAVLKYLRSNDRLRNLDDLSKTSNQPDLVWRFAAYRAIEMVQHELALKLLTNIQAKELKDHLAAAFSMIQIGDLEGAERTLNLASRGDWLYLELADSVIMHALISELERQRPITLIPSEFRETVRANVDAAGLESDFFDIDTQVFCSRGNWHKGL